MIRSFRPLPVVVATLLLLGAGTVVQAQNGRDGRGRGDPRAQQQQEADTLSDSVRRAQRDTDAQVLGAERVPFDGRDVNRIKLIDGRGRVRVYMDDPQGPRDNDRRPERVDPRDRRSPPTRNDDD